MKCLFRQWKEYYRFSLKTDKLFLTQVCYNQYRLELRVFLGGGVWGKEPFKKILKSKMNYMSVLQNSYNRVPQ